MFTKESVQEMINSIKISLGIYWLEINYKNISCEVWQMAEPDQIVGKILSEFRRHGGATDRDLDGYQDYEDDYPDQIMRQKRTKIDNR